MEFWYTDETQITHVGITIELCAIQITSEVIRKWITKMTMRNNTQNENQNSPF